MKPKNILFTIILFSLLTEPDPWAHEKSHKKPIVQADHHWSAPATARHQANPVPSSARSLERGKTLYLADCASCHGVLGNGDGPDAPYIDPKPSNLKAMSGHHSDGDLAWKIKKGKGSMPAWEGLLSEDQIWHLVNYIQSLKTP